MNLADYLPVVPDFPQPGIAFRDISPLLANPVAFRYAIDELAARSTLFEFDALAAIESRGLVFGSALALTLTKPFTMLRKPNKLPPRVHRLRYTLEYGEDELQLKGDVLTPQCRVLIIDDVLATGGTALAARELLIAAEHPVAAALFVLEIQSLGGRSRLESHHLPVGAALTV